MLRPGRLKSPNVYRGQVGLAFTRSTWTWHSELEQTDCRLIKSRRLICCTSSACMQALSWQACRLILIRLDFWWQRRDEYLCCCRLTAGWNEHLHWDWWELEYRIASALLSRETPLLFWSSELMRSAQRRCPPTAPCQPPPYPPPRPQRHHQEWCTHLHGKVADQLCGYKWSHLREQAGRQKVDAISLTLTAPSSWDRESLLAGINVSSLQALNDCCRYCTLPFCLPYQGFELTILVIVQHNSTSYRGTWAVGAGDVLSLEQLRSQSFVHFYHSLAFRIWTDHLLDAAVHLNSPPCTQRIIKLAVLSWCKGGELWQLSCGICNLCITWSSFVW